MRKIFVNPFKGLISNLRLSRKIQLTFSVVVIPLFVVFITIAISIFGANQKYDKVITNATEASRFSITFKEDFDYAVYLLVAYGESGDVISDIEKEISNARDICDDLINNTSIQDNKWRAERILKMLFNLEEYVKRIRENKEIGGFYDANYSIWENDVQIVTSLIQTTVLEYAYYETKGMNEVRSEINKELNDTLLISLIIFGCLTVIALLLTILIPDSIVKPIYHLNEITNKVANGDLSVRADELSGVEVKKLGHSLNTMIDKINQLVEAVKLDERHIREAELELLQSQINPHFLYNTLDTIIWLAESDDQEQVVSMVTSLSEFFRATLSEGSGFITLADEIKHVQSYLEIQSVRYQDILTYEIQFNSEFESVRIPKITLQPLVENALYHGIKNRRGKGEIHIGMGLDGEDLVVSVVDNGIGMTEDTLNRVIKNMSRSHLKQLESDAAASDYALYNVNERIVLKFGEGYGLTINSTYQKGTTVNIKIPFKTI